MSNSILFAKLRKLISVNDLSFYDLIIKSGSLLIPNDGLQKLEIGIKGDKTPTAKDIPVKESQYLFWLKFDSGSC
jgi:hypothetical protein